MNASLFGEGSQEPGFLASLPDRTNTCCSRCPSGSSHQLGRILASVQCCFLAPVSPATVALHALHAVHDAQAKTSICLLNT